MTMSKFMLVAASVGQAHAYLTGASINNYPNLAAVPSECQANFGVKVPDSCCTGAPVNSPFAMPPPGWNNITCMPLNLLANRGVPDVALAVYLNCEAGDVPTWAEFCYDTWVIPTPANCGNACSEITGARYNKDTAEQCMTGCKNVIRGTGCYPIRRPVEIGNWFTTGSDPVTGLSYPNFANGINTAAGNVATMLNYTNYGFVHLPACTSTIKKSNTTTIVIIAVVAGVGVILGLFLVYKCMAKGSTKATA